MAEPIAITSIIVALISAAVSFGTAYFGPIRKHTFDTKSQELQHYFATEIQDQRHIIDILKNKWMNR